MSTSNSIKLINAFTVDVEDYYQVTGFESQIDRTSWGGFESRVVSNTHRILELLASYHVHGTFFVLGWIAERHPNLVRAICDKGHEIGSHSSRHQLIYRQTPKEFREDLRRSRDILEDILGAPIRAYRAPCFSITKRSLWALEILVEEGFKVDSSIFPVYHDRYGIPDAKRGPHLLQTKAGPLWEFPPTVSRCAGINLPVGGGGYFRLFPISWTIHWLSYVQQHDRNPAMFYIHPWEIDPNQPRLRAGGHMSRFRHYVNLSWTESKLRYLLEQFSFGSVSEVLATHYGFSPLPVAAESGGLTPHEFAKT